MKELEEQKLSAEKSMKQQEDQLTLKAETEYALAHTLA